MPQVPWSESALESAPLIELRVQYRFECLHHPATVIPGQPQRSISATIQPLEVGIMKNDDSSRAIRFYTECVANTILDARASTSEPDEFVEIEEVAIAPESNPSNEAGDEDVK